MAQQEATGETGSPIVPVINLYSPDSRPFVWKKISEQK
jgi:hypothetical protein